jgi:hypothetical protein
VRLSGSGSEIKGTAVIHSASRVPHDNLEPFPRLDPTIDQRRKVLGDITLERAAEPPRWTAPPFCGKAMAHMPPRPSSRTPAKSTTSAGF